MASYKEPLVEIPDDKGIHIKSAGAKGEKYVYKYVKYFRNADGAPRNKAKAIGKLDPESGKMYPNNNYYDIYQLDPSLPDISVWDYGYTYLVLKVCHDSGLFDCLFQTFGDNAMDIVIMAAYMIREGNSMDGIDDWQQRNYFPGIDYLITSQTSSKKFASISITKQNEFFKRWVKVTIGSGSVCYDVTSISSYSQEMASVELGYNRDGENLGQYNLGMFCNETTKVPLYFNRYNGSLTDKTNLSSVLANAKSVGIERVKMVLDGGFWSKECLTSLQSLCDTFTMGMPLHLKDSKRILAAHGTNIDKYENELERRHHIYCVSVNKKVYGIPGKVLIYYDSYNHINQCIELSDRINKLKAELAALVHYPKKKLSRYTSYFVITKHDQGGGFDYVVDTEKVEKLRETKGYFLLFSTDMEFTPSDSLDYYRAKDVDEKLFAQIKVEMEGNRIRIHNKETTDGKAFVIFIACVIRSYMLDKLSSYLTDNSTSMKKVFNQLSNINILKGNDGYRFTKALTKKQKQILSMFNAVDDIKDSIK